MADLARFDNFILTTVKTAFGTGATTINVDTATSPFNSPASAPTNEQRALIFTDDLTSPTKFEIVYYTTVASDGGGGLNITGLTRNAESGGSLNSFSIGDYCYSAPTKGTMGFGNRLGFASGGGRVGYLTGRSFQLVHNASISLAKGTDIANTAAGVFVGVCQVANTNGIGALFVALLGSSAVSVSSGSLWTFGTTSEPGGSSDIAVWTPDSNTLVLKNRIGTTHEFAVIELTGTD